MLLGWIGLPAVLWWLAEAQDNLLWFAAHQVYYLPLGMWIGRPFFQPDSEVMFFVLPAGRVLVAVFYMALAGLIVLARRRWRHRHVPPGGGQRGERGFPAPRGGG
ncbi:hypothetical protein KQ945_03035 [Bacillus subtilis subsp. subtilis]|nr:hypothetical protein [Bacillus subtilis subsp. subtilis]